MQEQAVTATVDWLIQLLAIATVVSSQGIPIHQRNRHIIMRATPSGWPCHSTRSPG